MKEAEKTLKTRISARRKLKRRSWNENEHNIPDQFQAIRRPKQLEMN